VKPSGLAGLRPRAAATTTVLLALSLALAACGSDAAYGVHVSNATDVPVVFYLTGTTTMKPELPPERYHLQPGETFRDSWRAPFGDEPPATVRAEDNNGTLLFCRRYSYKEIQEVCMAESS
jgi:hypothetical protein